MPIKPPLADQITLMKALAGIGPGAKARPGRKALGEKAHDEHEGVGAATLVAQGTPGITKVVLAALKDKAPAAKSAGVA